MASKTRYLENVPFGSIEVRTTKTGESYKAVFRAPVTGRRISKTFKGSTEAREWLRGIARDIARDMWIDPTAEAEEVAAQEAENALTVEAWLTQFHDEILPRRATNKETKELMRVTTLQSYRRITRTRITEVDGEAGKLKDIPITKVTKADVVDWHNAIEAQFPDTATTNANAYKRLRAAFSEALERDLVPANPVYIRDAGTSAPKEKELPTDEEIAAIVAAFPERVRMGAVLCLYHGLRVGEMLALTREDVKIDREAGTAQVHVNATLQRVVNAETGKTEMLPAGCGTEDPSWTADEARAFYGEIPGARIVHLNGHKADNRLRNLHPQIADSILAQRAYQRKIKVLKARRERAVRHGYGL